MRLFCGKIKMGFYETEKFSLHTERMRHIMKIAVSSYSFSQAMNDGRMTIMDVIPAARKMGYEGVEIVKGGQSDEEMRALAKELKRQSDGEGIPVIAYMVGADFLKNGKMRTVSMHNPATLTCLGNDFGYEFVFSKQLELLARPGDLLVAISSSGNSPNILRAIETAKEKGCTVVTLTGFREDNRARQMGDFNVYVPSNEYGIVESVHNIVLQQAVDMLMEQNREDKTA